MCERDRGSMCVGRAVKATLVVCNAQSDFLDWQSSRRTYMLALELAEFTEEQENGDVKEDDDDVEERI